MPCGFRARSSSRGVVYGSSSQYTRHSRIRRAISWLYWAPKSRTRTVCAGEDAIESFQVMIPKGRGPVNNTPATAPQPGAEIGVARVEPLSARNDIGIGPV